MPISQVPVPGDITLRLWLRNALEVGTLSDEDMVTQIIRLFKAFIIRPEVVREIFLDVMKDAPEYNEKMSTMMKLLHSRLEFPKHREVVFGVMISFLTQTYKYAEAITEIDLYESIHGETVETISARITVLAAQDLAGNVDQINALVERSRQLGN